MPPNAPVAAGTRAPPFELPVGPQQTAGAADFVGRPLVLVFYPGDWEPASTDQLAQYQRTLPSLARFGAELVAISVDTVWSHAAFARMHRLTFPLLSDAEPKGAVARAYGVYDDATGTSECALFVVDRSGIVRWNYVSPRGVNPGVDGILTALEGMAPCPV